MSQSEELRRSYRTALMICAAMMAVLLVYIAVVEILKNGSVRLIPGFITLGNIQTIRYVFYFSAAFMVILIRISRGLIVRKKSRETQSDMMHYKNLVFLLMMIFPQFHQISTL